MLFELKVYVLNFLSLYCRLESTISFVTFSKYVQYCTTLVSIMLNLSEIQRLYLISFQRTEGLR